VTLLAAGQSAFINTYEFSEVPEGKPMEFGICQQALREAPVVGQRRIAQGLAKASREAMFAVVPWGETNS
jgi:hypothetical protein